MRKLPKYYFLFPFLVLLTGCSTTKNTFVSRSYHNITSRYNIFFNGTESFKKGINRAETSENENYSRLLPLFYYSDKSISESVTGDMDKAIKKATKVITLHSITAKPELKKGPQSPRQKEFYNKKEFNKWIDDNYLLMGKAYVYQNQFGLAAETFKYIINTFPDEPVRYAAFIWLARVYNETGEYRESEKILLNLQQDEKLPSKYRVDFLTSFTDLHIKEKNYEKAASMLEKALKLIRKKHYKIRYTYLLAQLWQEAGEFDKAVNTYKKVIRMDPPYEMTFNAKINMAGSFRAGSEGGKEILSLLRKMLKDEKNKDFQDQIYYALANISRKEGKMAEAIEFYKMSVSKSVSNPNQKGLSYLALGDIYYAVPRYTLAQAYYDSTMQNIENTYEDYENLNNKTLSLTHLVENLLIYEFEDSVQVLATLPETQLYAIIDTLIAQVVKKEEEEAKRKAEMMLDKQFGMMNQNSTSMDRMTGEEAGGSWYFYNLNAKGFGQPDFRMRWGNRKLEDNWRRLNKQVVENFETVETQEDSDTLAEDKKPVLSTKTREFYLQNIPFSDSALEKSNERKVQALFKMGEVYRNEFRDPENAISCFEKLVTGFPGHDLVFLSSYNLYEIYGQQNNNGKKEYYKQFIIERFPDNPRARILANPDYVKELEQEMNKVNQYYDETYRNYQEGNFSAVIRRADYAQAEFTESEELPRFLLLRALSAGQLEGREKLKTELDSLVSWYPNHETSKYAQELIDYIYQVSPDIKEADVRAEAEEIYVYDSAANHFVIIAAVKKADFNQINFNLINYNLDYFDNLNLGIQKAELAGFNLLAVQSFSSRENAERYRESMENRRDEIIGNYSPEDVKIFMITANNYDKLLKDNNIDKYLLFYYKYY